MRLDRNAFKSGTVFKHVKESEKYRGLSFEEKARIFAYLQSVAYNYKLAEPPKMDRTVHSVRYEKLT